MRRRQSLTPQDHLSNDEIELPASKVDFEEPINSYSDEARSLEFHNLKPLPQTAARTARLEAEAKMKQIYIPSATNEYWDLLDEINQLEEDLQSGLDVGISEGAANSITNMIKRKRASDPEHVYKITSRAAQSALRMGRVEESEKYRLESERARHMMPQFQLEGLWVGKYGSHGFEMINVTYSGDKLVAYKVTGDQNIPRGEITFTANLSPEPTTPSNGYEAAYLMGQQSLEPIVLSESSANKWGTKKLPRFPGQGHAAEPGFINNQFVEGQLVVIGSDYFSFAWVPLEHQIFFGRPSPELTLKMLREGGSSALTAGTGLGVPGLESSVKDQTDYVSRCLEVTCDTFHDDMIEGKVDEHSCIWHGDDDEYCYFE